MADRGSCRSKGGGYKRVEAAGCGMERHLQAGACEARVSLYDGPCSCN
jgi:hypothetical protein